MWFIAIFSLIAFVGSIFGIKEWNKNVNKWSIKNYPTEEEYWANLILGWGSMMMAFLSFISLIGSSGLLIWMAFNPIK